MNPIQFQYETNQERFERLYKGKLPPVYDNTKSGFFDLPNQETCNDPEHEPPKHLFIPQGKGYRHVCPKCKKQAILIPPQITH